MQHVDLLSPKVSVIVPCYNSAAFLQETLQSVENTVYENWECIIVNDGSTDETEVIAQQFCDADTRFRLIHTPDVGLSASRNAGIELSDGKYILPLDGDDKIHPDYIGACVNELEHQPKLSLVYCEAENFGVRKGIWKLQEFTFEWLAIENMIFCSAMFRRTDWERVGGYDEQLKQGFEDYEFWINLLKEGGQVKKLPFVGFYYRVRENSLTSKMLGPNWQQGKNYVVRKHYDFFQRQLGDISTLYVERNIYRRFYEQMHRIPGFKLLRKIYTSLNPNNKDT